jgi:hypothetical protein
MAYVVCASADARVAGYIALDLRTDTEEIMETLLRTFAILLRMQTSQQIIMRNLPIKRGNEAYQSLLSNQRVHVRWFHDSLGR